MARNHIINNTKFIQLSSDRQFSIQDDLIYYNKIIDNEYELLDKINISDLNKMAKLFDTDNVSSTIVLPKE